MKWLAKWEAESTTAGTMFPDSQDAIPLSCLASSRTWMQESLFLGQRLLPPRKALECCCRNASKTIYLPDVNSIHKSAKQVSLYHWHCFSALQIIKPFIVIWLKSAAFNCLVNYASLLALEVKHHGECRGLCNCCFELASTKPLTFVFPNNTPLISSFQYRWSASIADAEC